VQPARFVRADVGDPAPELASVVIGMMVAGSVCDRGDRKFGRANQQGLEWLLVAPAQVVSGA
jgi:hypothetical protein